MRIGIVDGRSFYRLAEIMATLITKDTVQLVKKTARWTPEIEFLPASLTKLGPFTVIKLALWAFHLMSLETYVEAGHQHFVT